MVIGDASEAGILRFVNMVQIPGITKIKTQFVKKHEIPFNSAHKYQLVEGILDNKTFTTIKGAPEIIIKMCNKYFTNGEFCSIDKQFLELF